MPDPPSLPLAGELLLAVLAIVAAVYDSRYRRIPNWLVLAGILAGFAWHVFDSRLAGLTAAAEGLGTGFILYFPLYILRARGAGDVKLLAAAGTITGALNCLWIFLFTAVLGGIIAMILLAFRGRVRKTFFNVAWIVRDISQFRAPYRSSDELDVTTNKGMRLPHGVLIAVGVAAFLVVAHTGLKV